MSGLRSKFVKGSMWLLLETFSLRFVSFFVSMILSRLLTPSDYGTIALITVFMSVAGTLTDFGFGTALVQKKDATREDFNSVFYLSIVLSLVAYCVLFFSAPAIARFYSAPVLIGVVRIAALSLIFGAINSVQGAELSRKMLFHLSFRISLLSTIPSAIVGVVMAFCGYGIWALVWQNLTAGVCGVVSRWFIIAWRPSVCFSFRSLKGLFSYGWKVSLDGILNTWFDDIYQFVIGKFYSPTDLAYLNKGKSTPQMLMGAINGTLSRAMFPVLVQIQNDKERIRDVTRKIVQVSSFLVFPVLMGFAACSHNLIILLFGRQWGMAVPYAQCVCFQLAQWPLSLVQLVLLATGNSGTLLSINIVRKIIALIVMAATLWISPLVFVAAMAFVCTPIATWTNTWPNKKLFNYTFKDELKDVAPIALCTGAMMAFAWGVDFAAKIVGFGGDAYRLIITRLALQFVGGTVIYIFLSRLLHVAAMAECIKMVMPGLQNRYPRIARVVDKLRG